MNTLNKKNTFSQNLIRLRKERGLSQRKLAELSGLTQRMIGYYENEAAKPPIDNIEIIAKVLNVSINELLGKNEKTDIQNEFSNLDTRTIRKLNQILSLPPEDRYIIYSITESLIAKNKLNQDSSK